MKLSVCSRHEGASFIVVKGLKDARKCSYLGELDSQEESDEISDEFEFAHHITELAKSAMNSSSSIGLEVRTVSDKKESQFAKCQ